MGGLAIVHKAGKGEGGKAMDDKATRGERKSIAGNETIAVGDAARDGMWPLRMGSVGGGAMTIGLVLTHLPLLRVSELFAEEN